MKKGFSILAFLVLLTLVLTACGGGAPTSAPASSGSAGGEEAAPPPTAAESGSAGGETATEPPAAPPANEAPADVPLMDGAYDIDIQRSGTQITYKVDADVQSVVDFYHEVLPPLGWEIKGPPDSVVGNIASMLRKNAADEQLTINMQYNPNAQFTVVTIALSRK